MTTGTEFTDTHELEAEQTRAYRVFAMNVPWEPAPRPRWLTVRRTWRRRPRLTSRVR